MEHDFKIFDHIFLEYIKWQMKYYRKPDIPTNLQKNVKHQIIFLWRGKKAKAPAAIIVHYTAVLNKYSKTDYNSIIVYFAYVCKFDKKCLSVCFSFDISMYVNRQQEIRRRGDD